VHPYLLYGIPVWEVTNATNLKRLQERATPYFVKTNILKIKEIYEIGVAKVMFRLTRYNKLQNFNSLPKLELYIIDQQDYQMPT